MQQCLLCDGTTPCQAAALAVYRVNKRFSKNAARTPTGFTAEKWRRLMDAMDRLCVENGALLDPELGETERRVILKSQQITEALFGQQILSTPLLDSIAPTPTRCVHDGCIREVFSSLKPRRFHHARHPAPLKTRTDPTREMELISAIMSDPETMGEDFSNLILDEAWRSRIQAAVDRHIGDQLDIQTPGYRLLPRTPLRVSTKEAVLSELKILRGYIDSAIDELKDTAKPRTYCSPTLLMFLLINNRGLCRALGPWNKVIRFERIQDTIQVFSTDFPTLTFLDSCFTEHQQQQLLECNYIDVRTLSEADLEDVHSDFIRLTDPPKDEEEPEAEEDEESEDEEEPEAEEPEEPSTRKRSRAPQIHTKNRKGQRTGPRNGPRTGAEADSLARRSVMAALRG